MRIHILWLWNFLRIISNISMLKMFTFYPFSICNSLCQSVSLYRFFGVEVKSKSFAQDNFIKYRINILYTNFTLNVALYSKELFLYHIADILYFSCHSVCIFVGLIIFFLLVSLSFFCLSVSFFICHLLPFCGQLVLVSRMLDLVRDNSNRIHNPVL